MKIQTQLNDEWAALCARPENDGISRRLQLWAELEPALAGFTRLADIETTRETADSVLGALLRLGNGSHGKAEPEAFRVVLQIMLLRLVYLSGLKPGLAGNREQTLHALLGAGWEMMIETDMNDPRRQRLLFAHLTLGSLRKVTNAAITELARAEAEDPQPELPRNEADAINLLWGRPEPSSPTNSGLSPDSNLDAVIEWALHRGVLRQSDADLLHTVYVTDEGRPGGSGSRTDLRPQQGGAAAAGQQLGISPEAVRKRCGRARNKLERAIHAVPA